MPGFTPQAFYKWRSAPCSDRDYSDAQVVNAIIDVYRDGPEFGYRFISDELIRKGWLDAAFSVPVVVGEQIFILLRCPSRATFVGVR